MFIYYVVKKINIGKRMNSKSYDIDAMDVDNDIDAMAAEMDVDNDIDEMALEINNINISETKDENLLFIKPKFFQLTLPKSVPENLSCKTYHDNNVWIKVKQQFSEGAYGNIYNSCNEKERDGCKYIAKEMEFDSSIYHQRFHQIHFIGECLITQFASDMKFGVPFLTYFLCDRGSKGVLVTEKFDGDLTEVDLTSQDIDELAKVINVMHECGILHLDLFPKNVVYKNNFGRAKNIKIIDFGLSIAFGKPLRPELKAIDYVTLINSFNSTVIKQILTKEAIRLCGPEAFGTAKDWIDNRKTNCGAEYFILKLLPDQIFRIYGPAVRTLLAWSTRCSEKNYKKISKIINKELKKRGLPLE